MIVIKKTNVGKVAQGVGFTQTSGNVPNKEQYYEGLKRNGYIVTKTKEGVFVSKG